MVRVHLCAVAACLLASSPMAYSAPLRTLRPGPDWSSTQPAVAPGLQPVAVQGAPVGVDLMPVAANPLAAAAANATAGAVPGAPSTVLDPTSRQFSGQPFDAAAVQAGAPVMDSLGASSWTPSVNAAASMAGTGATPGAGAAAGAAAGASAQPMASPPALDASGQPIAGAATAAPAPVQAGAAPSFLAGNQDADTIRDQAAQNYEKQYITRPLPVLPQAGAGQMANAAPSQVGQAGVVTQPTSTSTQMSNGQVVQPAGVPVVPAGGAVVPAAGGLGM